MEVYNEFKELIDDFERDVLMAKGIESPNPNDDLNIKTAIVGFSYNSPTEDWGSDHFNFVKERLERDYSEDELKHYGVNGENISLFFSLCIGFLLGLYQADKIGDSDFRLAEAQLPGFITLNLKSLTEKGLN